MDWLFSMINLFKIKLMESIRFTNFGTEATLPSVRGTYTYTGEYKESAKFEEVLINIYSTLKMRDQLKTKATLVSKGIHPDQLKKTIIVLFNDLEKTTEVLTEIKIASVILGLLREVLFPRK